MIRWRRVSSPGYAHYLLSMIYCSCKLELRGLHTFSVPALRLEIDEASCYIREYEVVKENHGIVSCVAAANDGVIQRIIAIMITIYKYHRPSTSHECG